MKVKHVLMIAAVLLAMLVMPVAAADTAQTGQTQIKGSGENPTFEFTIPTETVFDNTGNAVLNVELDQISDYPGLAVTFVVTSANNFAIVHESGAHSISYTLKNGDIVIGNGDIAVKVLEVGEYPLNLALEEDFRYKAGNYADTLTFTVDLSKPTPVSNAAELVDALTSAESGDTIVVAAGSYTFPTSELKNAGDGVTLVCAEGTVFEGNSKANINGATVIGATFSNPSGTAVDQTINGVFKDCTFTGSNGLRYCYAGDNVVFENCEFSGSVYGAHFDGGANDVVFKGCTFSGFNTFGAAITQLTLEDCKFISNGLSNYNGVNLWGDTELINCEFIFDGSASNEWVDLCGDGQSVTFTNCVVVVDAALGTEKPIEDVVGNYGDDNTITIDSVVFDIPNMS